MNHENILHDIYAETATKNVIVVNDRCYISQFFYLFFSSICCFKMFYLFCFLTSTKCLFSAYIPDNFLFQFKVSFFSNRLFCFFKSLLLLLLLSLFLFLLLLISLSFFLLLRTLLWLLLGFLWLFSRLMIFYYRYCFIVFHLRDL